MKQGSWLKLAERKLTGFDPQPDLDNANVGQYRRFFRRIPRGFLLFCAIFSDQMFHK